MTSFAYFRQKFFLTSCGQFSCIPGAYKAVQIVVALNEQTKDTQMVLCWEVIFAKAIGYPFGLLGKFLIKSCFAEMYQYDETEVI